MLYHLPPIGQLLGVLFPYWELALLADPLRSFLLWEGWGSPTGGKVALFPTFRVFGFSMFFVVTVFSYMFMFLTPAITMVYFLGTYWSLMCPSGYILTIRLRFGSIPLLLTEWRPFPTLFYYG